MAGHGIVIDEINSSPMLELELNAMLMGKTLDGKRPDKPGFFMFGTQNPITMAGRRATSTAIKRRVITINLPEYTSAEMVTILCNKGLAKELASQLVLAYEHNVNRAQKEHLTPVPTFRDLLRVSKSFLRDEQRGIKRKEREDDKEYRRDKKKDKGKEKEKEKEKEEELLFSGDKAYYYKELKSLLEKHLNYAKSQDRFFASWEDRSEISIINKILVFLETNTTIPEINPGELEAINNAQQLGNLMSEMVRNGFLDGSGLQWNGLEIELSNTNITGLRNMDF